MHLFGIVKGSVWTELWMITITSFAGNMQEVNATVSTYR